MLEKLQTYLEGKLKESILQTKIAQDELSLWVKTADLVQVLYFLRDDEECAFKQLVDICGVDYPHRSPRFEVVYHLLSLHHNLRLRLKVLVKENEAVSSVLPVFKAAGWWEREVWDMFGIPFAEHPDLRRILTDYTFEGFPLRKDFPLTGFVEVRYDHVCKEVIYEPVNLQQEFRRFDYLSPWEGTDIVMPEDEKKEGAANG